MEKFEYTQCSLNLANADAIVYRFANGEVSEITAADFDGNEKLFRKWKRLSDKYYIDERDLMYRISYKDVSINELEDTDLTHLPSMEDMIKRLRFHRPHTQVYLRAGSAARGK